MMSKKRGTFSTLDGKKLVKKFKSILWILKSDSSNLLEKFCRVVGVGSGPNIGHYFSLQAQSIVQGSDC